jgi:uncharacterized membrane protein
MKSKAAISGHPIHPMFVAVPIGLAVWTLIADIVYILTDKDPTWYDISYWSGLAFWVSALIAALPGFVDFFTVAMKSDAKNIAVAHMALNLTVTGLFLVSTLLMRDDGAVTGSDLTLVVVLHLLGVGLLGLSGWLGGEMVFRHHIGMVPDDGRLEAEERAHHSLGSGMPRHQGR